MQPVIPAQESGQSAIFPERPVVYASFGRRFVALLIDYLVLLVPISVINSFIIPYLQNQVQKNGVPYDMGQFFLTMGAIYISILVIEWLYFALQEAGAAQATLGKRAMSIIVTDVNGNRLSFAAATGRFFGKILSGLLFGFGFFMVLWDDRNQGLHDKIANTLVLRL